MPKKEVDYSNTIIYKICCKDETIKDVYVGHTTNFIQRKYAHKISCINLNTDLKIYNVIRNNGGWDNWNMIELAKYECKDVTEARIKEQEHYNELKSSLNSNPPYVDKTKLFCSLCNLQCFGTKQYNEHIKCNKHINKSKTNGTDGELRTVQKNLEQKILQEYNCNICNYNTCNVKDYNKHLTTSKHLNRTNLNNLEQKIPENPKEFKCKNCNKYYKARNSLWYHQQKCFPINNDLVKKFSALDKDELIIQLLKQNAELIKGQQDMMINQQDMIIKLSENGINNNTNHSHNTTTNSHNKAFNLNFFLNETCKNAMNITDFVDSIKLQLSDLMDIGEVGYVEGISKIIVKNLNNLDETERPIHCTDKKRETMYIKDEGQWEKEDDNKTKLKKVVNKVSDKNIRLLPQFREKFPDYKNASSKTSDKYEKMVIEVMSTQDDKKEKVIKKISNATIIKK
jgi:hypothetical protein